MKTIISSLKKKHLDTVNNLLSENISSFKLSKKNYTKVWKLLYKQKNNFYIVVTVSNKVIGFGSIIIFLKARGNYQGIIEDVVVDKKYRKKFVGRLIVNKLLKLAKNRKCYKVVLQSNKKALKFYKKLGFKQKNYSMQIIF